MERKQKENVLQWNAGKPRLRACENSVGLSPFVMVLWKLSLSKGGSLLRREVGWDRVRYWLPLLRFWSYFTACIDLCIEKTRGDSRVKLVLRICLVQATRWKCGNGGASTFWWTVLARWFFTVVPVWKSVGDRLTGEAESSAWVARTRTWQPGSPNESRMGYLPWLIPCRLLRLNLGARGEHFIIHLSWIAAWLLVTHVFPVYLVDELALVSCTLPTHHPPYDWTNGGSIDIFCSWRVWL